ncbi:glutaminyl-tRNA synthase (glutamine-hydrolyzing) subunit B [Candidatus Nomurabacteria bacterium RIFCSPHIGHO2_02_FULL_33_12]|uniref:Aspartyl/glutamyl-tRNA(Asn/Gln) amidotransferase subunit B n=1 Tax=Candidatus Nomurabacteria bacterium RIFCSPLOWO2_01_FULL_33_17 TaxID=1801764 RepID=A0A1F6WQY3_9BACT|nr:MAG: glutaminyl-tRNA synthase (glutamine-hydrolyzing) subunit B [Candidatus Nomurabacteria bacterium RIFCSPHIGHO2_02_FULL_33_12]OGI84224.1 MAG: glutaminyl-tRNA synthase (glutamine-hydrolyzing) subunit B [Candidatus Nomurabacteria bacterium RIFCSPLOWO2_01_FULL_33_17]
METKRPYYVTIGLEIHVELKTNTKAFCSCKNESIVIGQEDLPNTNVCPVCTGQPGTLPVLNKAAVDHMVRVGLAIGAEIADFTEFDRKNYFYPDIPKAYQISQYKFPIVSGGKLARIDITRVHLEEDTATSSHDTGGYSLINYNRAGVPLMELVTEPLIRDTETIVVFAKELQLLLRTLGASDANMERGQMRVEVNVSISPDRDKPWPKYVEVKNINSFQAAKKAAEYEISRMTDLWENGRENEIIKETRGWDENKQITISQRSKENAEDYRYFPEPDLPKLYLHSMYDLDEVKNSLPELPWQMRERYKKDFDIKDSDIEIFVNEQVMRDFFEAIVTEIHDKNSIQLASNYITSDLAGIMKTDKDALLPTPEDFAELMKMAQEGELSSRGVKDILFVMVKTPIKPKDYATEHDLIQKNDPEFLKNLAQKLISENPDVVASYKSGKENAIMSLVGKIMKESGGSANPQMAKDILLELLK